MMNQVGPGQLQREAAEAGDVAREFLVLAQEAERESLRLRHRFESAWEDYRVRTEEYHEALRRTR